MVLGIGFDEVVDPGIFQGLSQFFFGDDPGNFTAGLLPGKNRTTEEALVNFGEGLRLSPPRRQAKFGQFTGPGMVFNLRFQVGITSTIQRSGEEDHREFSGMFFHQFVEVFFHVAAGSAGVVEVFDEDVLGVGRADKGQFRHVEFLVAIGKLASTTALMDGFVFGFGGIFANGMCVRLRPPNLPANQDGEGGDGEDGASGPGNRTGPPGRHEN